MSYNIVTSVPSGTFKGQNMMTPYWLAYYKGTIQGATVYCELTKGRGIYNETLYGVTFHREGGENMPGVNSCFQSNADALAHIGRVYD